MFQFQVLIALVGAGEIALELPGLQIEFAVLIVDQFLAIELPGVEPQIEARN